MPKLSRVAQRRTREQIEEAAWQARGDLGILPGDRVPVAKMLELVLPRLLPEFEMRVAGPGELGEAEAVTHQSKPVITFSQATYDGLYRDAPRPRMTAVHELAHLLLHTGQYAYAFSRRYDPLIDPERQADVFASAFLMPEGEFKRVKSITEAMHRFGVSRDAATCRARSLKMWRLVQAKPEAGRAKKKGHSMRRAP